jgi:transcriptional regulator with XRE-family HTH domain
MTNTTLPHAADYIALGRALSRLRRRAGLTQVQAAERIGIRSQFVSEVERARRGMRWHTLRITLNAYDASLRELAEEIERGESD